MASFLSDLWSSVFTPGATPTLLVATNASFAALQAVLFALLYATHSIHFVILSGLCGALWWAINWFVGELDAAKTKEIQKGQRTEQPAVAAKEHLMRPPGAMDSTDSETETESVKGLEHAVASAATAREAPPELLKRESTPAAPNQPTVEAVPRDVHGIRQRHPTHDSSGYVSTDSEWEKVEEKQ